jgi:hypothetical protein
MQKRLLEKIKNLKKNRKFLQVDLESYSNQALEFLSSSSIAILLIKLMA